MKRHLSKLNGWQRLWLVLSAVWLVVFLCLVVDRFPTTDPKVIADLKSPDSQSLRDLPQGFKLDEFPDRNTPCRALALFRFSHTSQVRTVADYQRVVRREQIITALNIVAAYVVSIVVVYVFGWSVGWIIQGFRKKNGGANNDIQPTN